MKIKYPIVVEGKYDKIKLDSLVEATVITTQGFGVFNNKELLSLLRRLSEKSKIIILTDSDGGGHLIRSHIKTAIPADRLINLYIPKITGKEKRKNAPSKEGILGVEGISKDSLLELLKPFSTDMPQKEGRKITKSDMYLYGLSGRDDSKRERERVLSMLNLPNDMSPNAMLSAINILYTKEEFEEIIKK